jgi:hypothetical protein
MSAVKLGRGLVDPSDSTIRASVSIKRKSVNNLSRDHTFGVTSDPITQFGTVFAAIIHNVDHPGVPNAQLLAENSPLMATYKEKSIAEQNSFDIAWNLLLDDKFTALLNVIWTDATEKARFRQVVVNAVMATDILDMDLKALRIVNVGTKPFLRNHNWRRRGRVI